MRQTDTSVLKWDTSVFVDGSDHACLQSKMGEQTCRSVPNKGKTVNEHAHQEASTCLHEVVPMGIIHPQHAHEF